MFQHLKRKFDRSNGELSIELTEVVRSNYEILEFSWGLRCV